MDDELTKRMTKMIEDKIRAICDRHEIDEQIKAMEMNRDKALEILNEKLVTATDNELKGVILAFTPRESKPH